MANHSDSRYCPGTCNVYRESGSVAPWLWPYWCGELDAELPGSMWYGGFPGWTTLPRFNGALEQALAVFRDSTPVRSRCGADFRASPRSPNSRRVRPLPAPQVTVDFGVSHPGSSRYLGSATTIPGITKSMLGSLPSHVRACWTSDRGVVPDLQFTYAGICTQSTDSTYDSLYGTATATPQCFWEETVVWTGMRNLVVSSRSGCGDGNTTDGPALTSVRLSASAPAPTPAPSPTTFPTGAPIPSTPAPTATPTGVPTATSPTRAPSVPVPPYASAWPTVLVEWDTEAACDPSGVCCYVGQTGRIGTLTRRCVFPAADPGYVPSNSLQSANTLSPPIPIGTTSTTPAGLTTMTLLLRQAVCAPRAPLVGMPRSLLTPPPLPIL